MNFQDLHELLRLELLRRIEMGTLTGTLLARQADFQPAHISNFLHHKRSLSMEGLDRVLAAQGLTVEQILPLGLEASHVISDVDQSIEKIPIVGPSAAMYDQRISAAQVIENAYIAASSLHTNRARPSAGRSRWQRFLGIRVDAQQAFPMEPLITPGAIVIIDRHYNSLAPYRAPQPTLFAVRSGTTLTLRFVDLDAGRLILRPYSLAFPVQLLIVGAHEMPTDYIVGRVCLTLTEP